MRAARDPGRQGVDSDEKPLADGGALQFELERQNQIVAYADDEGYDRYDNGDELNDERCIDLVNCCNPHPYHSSYECSFAPSPRVLRRPPFGEHASGNRGRWCVVADGDVHRMTKLSEARLARLSNGSVRRWRRDRVTRDVDDHGVRW